MKKIKFAAFVSLFLVICFSAVAGESVEGKFVMAGPINATAEELSMHWQYGLMLNVDPEKISGIKFSCDPIPGTSFSVKGSELKRLKNGALFVDGPFLAVSKESTAWLFDGSTTTANCSAVVSTADQHEASITAKVNFSGPMKVATLQQLKMAYEFNRPQKKE